jgi:hypothetical protein
MMSLWRRLPLWAAAWLVFQVASLAALVPRDCCAAHRAPTSSAEHGCHKTTAATHCPMRGADGTPCPMHRGRDARDPVSSSGGCSLRSTCSEPMVALAALLWNQGVLAEPLDVVPDSGLSVVAAATRDPIVNQPDSPDPPPPRT